MVHAERSSRASWRWQRNDPALISLRGMPAYKVGRLWKFKLSEVDDWVRSGGAAETVEDKKED